MSEVHRPNRPPYYLTNDDETVVSDALIYFAIRAQQRNSYKEACNCYRLAILCKPNVNLDRKAFRDEINELIDHQGGQNP